MPFERPGGDSLGGMKRGGCSARRLRVRIGASVEQHLRHGRMPVAGRDHQRRLAEARVARVDGGAVLEQRSRDLRVADVRREHAAASRRPASRVVASAPASSKRRVSAASPCSIARCSGVTP